MSERSKYLTVIVSDPTKEEASALIGHPKMSAASWSHAINDRDAKDAEIAELRARIVECEEAVDQAVALAEYLEGHSKGAMAERVRTALSSKFAQDRKRERDEARAELAEWNALGTAVIYGGVPARDTPTLWPNPWRQTIAMVSWAHHDIAGQRDEARECVKRLAQGLRNAASNSYGPDRAEALAVLAATPEHLR